MTPEETIQLAQEAGIEFQSHVGVLGRTNVTTRGSQSIEKIQRLIALAVAKEREACARIAAGQWSNVAEKLYGIECAAAIRARGQKEGA